MAVANAVGLLLGGSFFGFIFIGTLYMQQVLHYSALQAGIAWLAASITSVALAGLSQLLVTRISAGPVMALGLALMALPWACAAPPARASPSSRSPQSTSASQPDNSKTGRPKGSMTWASQWRSSK